jgi:sugar O-acyltransferase (sialic acid O-acetyltransferase NeuD family)
VGARELVIIGTGGLGRETLWAFEGRPDVVVRGFLSHDREAHGSEVCGLPVLGDEYWAAERPEVEVVCAIGAPRGRRALVSALRERGVRFAGAVHPSVRQSEFVDLGAGCIIGAHAVLTSQVQLGEHVVIGVGAVVSHDCVVDAFATLAPGVVLAGGVRIELGAELGAGATVIPGKRVGRGALVGAGATVVADVPPNVVAAGVPARVLRELPGPDRL